MRRLDLDQIDAIRDVVNEGLSTFQPAAFEKDIHISFVLEALEKFDHDSATFHFGGGTSLVKAFRFIERMSEDIDITLEIKNGLTSNAERKMLRSIRDEMLQHLTHEGFTVSKIEPQNRYKYFGFNLQYEPAFDQVASLRPEIKLDFSTRNLALTPIHVNTKTLLGDHLEKFSLPVQISCKAFEETLAEKVVSYLRRTREIYKNTDQFEERLIRHIYDVHAMKSNVTDWSQVQKAFTCAVELDRLQFASQDQEFFQNPFAVLLESLELVHPVELEGPYELLVKDLLADQGQPLTQVVESFREVALLLLGENYLV